MAAVAEQTMKLSFGFSKKIPYKQLQDSKLRDESTKPDEEKVDLVLSLADKRIESSRPSKEKTELVIPLIAKNNWKLPSTLAGSNVKTGIGTSEIENQAIQEILAEARKAKDEDDSSEKDSNLMIQFMQNQAPKEYENDDNLDVSLRADEPTLQDYMRIPVEEYGLAMLRGMGWKPDEGIGAKNKRVVAPVEPVLRPKGLGLGADPKVKLKKVAQNEEIEEKDLAIGSYVKIVSGSYKGMYGQVESLDVDNARVLVKLALNSNSASLSEHSLSVVSKSEYKKEGKLLNKAKYDEYKAKSDAALEEFKRREEEKHHSTDESHFRNDSNSEKKDRKRKHSPDASKRYKHKHKSSRSSETTWACPLLRVRFINKSYKNGRYFNTKMIIEDVVKRNLCICRTDSDHILEEIPDSWLETLIPKESPLIVMVVKGRFKGQLAEILDKQREKYLATIQLLQDKTVTELDFDSICEYRGKQTDY